MGKTERLTAYLLHRRPYRESSWLLECFTRELGRIRLIGRTAGKSGRARQAELQPFTPLSLTVCGRGELRTLVQSESLSLALPLSGEALFCGLYLNELLSYLLHGELAADELFGFYHDTVVQLSLCSLDPDRMVMERALRRFEIALLASLGYALDLRRAQSKMVDEQLWYSYLPQTGLQESAESGSDKMSFSGADLLKIANDEFDSQNVLQTAKRLTKLALSPLLNGRELKSRQLFRR